MKHRIYTAYYCIGLLALSLCAKDKPAVLPATKETTPVLVEHSFHAIGLEVQAEQQKREDELHRLFPWFTKPLPSYATLRAEAESLLATESFINRALTIKDLEQPAKTSLQAAQKEIKSARTAFDASVKSAEKLLKQAEQEFNTAQLKVSTLTQTSLGHIETAIKQHAESQAKRETERLQEQKKSLEKRKQNAVANKTAVTKAKKK